MKEPKGYNHAAEAAVIGALLMRGMDALAEIGDVIGVQDFTNDAMRRMFALILAYSGAGKAFDLALLMADAKAMGGSVSMEAARAVSEYVPTRYLLNYCKAIREATLRRQIHAVGVEIARMAGEVGEVIEIVEKSQAMTLHLGSVTPQGDGLKALSFGTTEWLDNLDERSRKGSGLSGISTGFRDLDRKTGGLEPGTLVVIAGRPSMGKTALAVSIGLSAAEAQQAPICMFSMEMGHKEIISRAVSRFSGVDLLKLRTGELSQDEWAKINQSLSKLPRFDHFLVDDRGTNPVPSMRAKALRVKASSGGKLSMVIVDYVQLMKTEADTRAGQIAEITRDLKALAKELWCPIILISQLNRDVEKRQDRRPMMADLKESGAIEQDADLILFVYRDVVYNPGTLWPGAAEILIGKQRNGPTGAVLLLFNETTASFVQMDNTSQQLYWEQSRKQGGKRGYD